MVKRKQLTDCLDEILQLDRFTGDRSNNGLQVEGNDEVKKAVFCVDISVNLTEQAIEKKADFIFVHHGLSWGDSLRYITRYNASLVRPLLKNNISLYAAHLPLDAHQTIGHNALLSDMLQLQKKRMFAKYEDIETGFIGNLQKPLSVSELSEFINKELSELIHSYSQNENTSNESPCFILDNNKKVSKVGVISGGSGINGITAAIAEEIDCLITGEFNHQNYHHAKENGLAVIAAGHYKTETPGLFGVMDLIKEKFGIETEFVDIPTGL